MKEEQAVFELGRKFSAKRHSGHDLPLDKVLVGNSYVSPTELADEYDRQFPPGPKIPKLVTNRQIKYELSYIQGSDRPEQFGLVFWIEGKKIDFLSQKVLFYGGLWQLGSKITTTPDNRYDIIDATMKLVIDKLEERISVLIASLGYGPEVPVMGKETRWLRHDEHGRYDPVYFPFLPFQSFWETWDEYEKQRLRQIDELKNVTLQAENQPLCANHG